MTAASIAHECARLITFAVSDDSFVTAIAFLSRGFLLSDLAIISHKLLFCSLQVAPAQVSSKSAERVERSRIVHRRLKHLRRSDRCASLQRSRDTISDLFSVSCIVRAATPNTYKQVKDLMTRWLDRAISRSAVVNPSDVTHLLLPRYTMWAGCEVGWSSSRTIG